MSEPDISCIICTRDRADSLRLTLEHLANADRCALEVEVVIVDNGSTDGTLEVAHAFENSLRIRILREPECAGYGKAKCLNRALSVGGLGGIIAILDDDMSPHDDWFQGVAAISRRHPRADLFTGRSYVVWPAGHRAVWTGSRRIRSWAYSVSDWGAADHPLPPGRWFSGNHFWFRKRVLDRVDGFGDRWSSEADFQLDAVAAGCSGMAGPDAVVAHRVQPCLLEPGWLAQRAELVGRRFAEIRLCMFRPGVRIAEAFRRHPLLMRMGCRAAWMSWCFRRMMFRAMAANGRCVDRHLEAIEREHYFRRLLSISAGRSPE